MNILDLLEQNKIEWKRSGSSTVCRCPFCKDDNNLKSHNAQINTDTNTLYCFSEAKTYFLKDMYKLFGIEVKESRLIEISTTQKFLQYAQELRKKHKETFEDLLEEEIPRQLWNEGRESYKNAGLYEDQEDNYKLKLSIQTSQNTVVRRNKKINGNIVKWQHFGHVTHWKRLNGKKIVFFASGVAEWLILDWLNVDYFVLRSDSNIRDILHYKDILERKIIAVLPDHDEPKVDKKSSFEQITDFLKENFSNVVVLNFYDVSLNGEKDLRDHARVFFEKEKYSTKEDFEQMLYEAVYYAKTGNTLEDEDEEEVTEELVISKIKEEKILKKRADFIVGKEPEIICKNYLPLARHTVNLLAAFGGSGKSWLALNETLCAAKEGLKTMYYTSEDSIEYLVYRLQLLKPFYKDFDTLLKNIFFEKANQIDYAEDYFDLVIYDPLLSYFDGKNENDNKEARDFVTKLVDYAEKTKTTILLIHHTSKNFDAEIKARGASAFIDSARSLWEIEYVAKEAKKEEDKRDYNIYTERKLLLKKDNFGISKYIEKFELILKIKPKLENELIENNNDDDNDNGGKNDDRKKM